MLFDIGFFAVSFLIMGLTYYFLFIKKRQSIVVQQPQPQQPQQQPARRNIGRVQVEENSDSDGNDAIDHQTAEQQVKREAKRQKKQQQQQYLKQQFELKEKKQSERSKQYEEKERERELEEAQEEEWKKKIEAEQKLKEEQEFDKWKDLFTIEAAGKNKLSKEEEERKNSELLIKLNRYIKLRKVVQLDELSSEFGLTIQEIVDRIKQLEQSKELNGLIDERGKYIYISQNEISSVINFINAKGKVSRQDLLSECNRLIRLDPTKQDLEILKEEQQSLLQDLTIELSEQQQQ